MLVQYQPKQSFTVDYISIGKIVSIHGIKGQLVLEHALGKKTDLKGVKAFFIQDKTDSWFPWFIIEAKARSSSQTLISVEEIDTPEKARKLLQKTVWLKQKDFTEQASASAALSLIGFTVIDGEKRLGEIVEVIEQPHQLLCTILIDKKEVYIPLHDESLQKVDRKKKLVYVDLPEGLLELYL